jgi:hypothetical protein
VGEPAIYGQPGIQAIPPEDTMSWSELERLVEEAEADGVIRRALRHCRSRRELLLAGQRLGYGISSDDLHQAWELHRQESLGEMPAHPVEPQTGESLPLAS